MYNYLAMKQGVDPENQSAATTDKSTENNTRKVAGPEAAALLLQLSKIKSDSKGALD